MMRKVSTTPVTVMEGDGIGPEIMAAAMHVMDSAVEKCYAGQRRLVWESNAEDRQMQEKGGYSFSQSTLDAIRKNRVALKGPMRTPVGGGIRSLNVFLRQTLDLYVCMRPVQSINALLCPLKQMPELDVVIFRENSEDLYSGVEFNAGGTGNQRLLEFLAEEFPQEYEKIPFKEQVGIGLKPISKEGSQRFVRAAIRWAAEHHRKKITFVHKGNIMKYTEGAFLRWAYDIAENEFADVCDPQRRHAGIQKAERPEEVKEARERGERKGRMLVDDLIADVAFEQIILQPHSFDVLVTTNLNGDYLSDAFAALAGGVGISPSANLNPELGLGIFEANHGSADELTGLNRANPCSLILSGAMLLDFIHWGEAALLVRQAIQRTIEKKVVTFDLARLIPDASIVGTREFSQHVTEAM